MKVTDDKPIWSPPASASCMNLSARLERRGSTYKYQIAAWVSAMATSIKCRSGENLPTFHAEPRQFLQQMGPCLDQPIILVLDDALLVEIEVALLLVLCQAMQLPQLSPAE